MQPTAPFRQRPWLDPAPRLSIGAITIANPSRKRHPRQLLVTGVSRSSRTPACRHIAIARVGVIRRQLLVLLPRGRNQAEAPLSSLAVNDRSPSSSSLRILAWETAPQTAQSLRPARRTSLRPAATRHCPCRKASPHGAGRAESRCMVARYGPVRESPEFLFPLHLT